MSKKILIVDDDFNIRLLLNRVLRCFKPYGVDLLFAENGNEALSMALKEKPDLMFLDVMMPGLNGYDVCNEIKNTHNIDNIYIIFVTAKGQEWDKDMGNKVGSDDYLIKPFSPDELIKKTENVLNIKIDMDYENQ